MNYFKASPPKSPWLGVVSKVHVALALPSRIKPGHAIWHKVWIDNPRFTGWQWALLHVDHVRPFGSSYIVNGWHNRHSPSGSGMDKVPYTLIIYPYQYAFMHLGRVRPMVV
jgi:hypothetical protein